MFKKIFFSAVILTALITSLSAVYMIDASVQINGDWLMLFLFLFIWNGALASAARLLYRHMERKS